MSNAGNTREPVENGRKAEQLVGEADELLASALAPGHWPDPEDVERFLSEGKLDRVLALYGQAIRLEPKEPSYPWNLGSTLNRLGLNDLALGFLSRAIHLAAENGEDEWSGADAQLALAEVAMDASEYDLALTALAHAREADESRDLWDQVKDLLVEIGRQRKDPKPQAALVSLLEQLPA
jgi:tetratricopeptide (TPR) repeat protein